MSIFFDPHVNTNIQPLKGTGKPKFPPINFSEFLKGELKASYEKHKELKSKQKSGLAVFIVKIFS